MSKIVEPDYAAEAAATFVDAPTLDLVALDHQIVGHATELMRFVTLAYQRAIATKSIDADAYFQQAMTLRRTFPFLVK